jgi:hypothetical protein
MPPKARDSVESGFRAVRGSRPPKKKPDGTREHVHAAGDPTEPHVEHGNQRDGDAAQAVEIVAVELTSVSPSRCSTVGRAAGAADGRVR